ncbi:MAG: leucine--tRNA ligase [Candidatus Dormibacteria bacterium]
MARPTYDPSEIEPRWQQRWAEDALYRAVDFDDSRPKWYALVMFPYTSGDLHVGHWFAYTGPDMHARYKRMRGYNVLFPFGFDAFGLPAENAAIKDGIHPSQYTRANIDRMLGQLGTLGSAFEFDRRVETSDPDYYRWTQWIFLKLYEKGLAYRASAPVNWCPQDQTVLANEQVSDGHCDRCGSPVIKKELEQWFFRITRYAEELLNFEGLDWPEKVVTMQTNWIGRSEGLEMDFPVPLPDGAEEKMRIFTTRPDTLFGVTFMVLAPEHPLVHRVTTAEHRAEVEAYVAQARNASDIDRQSTEREKTGVFTGGYAVNPVSGERVPIWVADYVLVTYGTGAIMAVPGHDERDYAFARKFGIPVAEVISATGEPSGELTEAYLGEGTLINSGRFDGLVARSQGIQEIVDHVKAQGWGEPTVAYRLRDWLLSRQRYWGAPIPMVHCPDDGLVPVPEDQLPVRLPEGAEFRPTGDSPLASVSEFVETTCPRCGKPARRETDTMDTFVDSSWYYLRYASPNHGDGPWDPEALRFWLPVDQYMGGIEHAILHLLYSRFYVKALRDCGLLGFSEPFLRLRNQGMITYASGKMSKSRGNVVAPDEMVRSHGADAVRLYMLFIAPWSDGGVWNEEGIDGTRRFLTGVHYLATQTYPGDAATDGDSAEERELVRMTHQTIKRCTDDMEHFKFNTYVSSLMKLRNALQDASRTPTARTSAYRHAIDALLLLLAPAAPHLAEELWTTTGHQYSVHQQRWPTYDEGLLAAAEFELVVQVNGKVRDRMLLPVGVDEDHVRQAALGRPKVAELLDGRSPKKIIYISGKLLSIVV